MSLVVDNLALTYATKNVFSDVSFSLEAGEIACLLGESGCGKTSVLRCIAGFETPATGEIHLNDQLIVSQSTAINMPAHQRGIGLVFQNYALFPHLTIADNIGFGLFQHSKTQKQHRIDELLAFIGLSGYQNRYPHELSGGQQQRVALARALAPKPRLILLDEPFSGLDAQLRPTLAKEVRTLLKQQQTQAIVVTHDQQEAFAMADKIGLLAKGQLQQWATPSELYHQPKTTLVAKFIGQGSLIHASPSSDGLVTALGTLQGQYCYFAESQQVLIRPEMLQIITHQLADANQLNPKHSTATVIDCEFKGSHNLCQLQLASQETVYAYAPAFEHLVQGQKISLTLNSTVTSNQSMITVAS